MLHNVEMIGYGVDVRQRFGDGGELFGRDVHATLVELGQEEVDKMVAVNTCLDVHDAVQSRHLTQQSVEIQGRPAVATWSKPASSLSQETVSG